MLTMSLLFEGGATPDCATLQRFRLSCSRCKSRLQLPTFALPMLSHPALCSPDSGFLPDNQNVFLYNCLCFGNHYKNETPQKVEVFCRVSNILCRSLDTLFRIASLPLDCAAKISYSSESCKCLILKC